MPSITQLLDYIDRFFGQGIEHEVARHLFDFLEKNSDTTYINLQLVRQMTPGANTGVHDAAIVKTLQFLSGDAAQVLSVEFELFDDEDHAHKLTKEEVREALELNVNPLTGEKDVEIRGRVAMYFSPTAEVMRLLGRGRSSSGG